MKITVQIIGLIFVLFLTLSLTFKEDTKKPNILFILTDDQRFDELGYAGNKIIQTPEMDKLASEGVYFSNALVTTPICMASRASILTGLYERTHGYTLMTKNLDDKYIQQCYPLIMKQNGYYTGLFGKLGVNINGAEELFDVLDDYDRDDKSKDRRGYFYKTIDGDTVHLTRFTGYQAQEFIKNAPADKPFCLSLSFSAPHAHDPAPEQYFWQQKSDHLYSDVTIPDPPLADSIYFKKLPVEVQKGLNRTRWSWRFDTPEKYQHSVKGYYRMITEVDQEIGEIRALLRERGLEENTVIIFMGDNGYFLGERQLAGKWLMYDNSIRVPMMIYDPRAKKHRDVEDIVANIDIPKTILDLAHVEIPESYQGISLVPYLNNENIPEKRSSMLVEHLFRMPFIPSSEGIRTDEWKYFRYRFISDSEELYNLKNDPLETSNLAKDPVYSKIVTELRQECDGLIKKYEDQK